MASDKADKWSAFPGQRKEILDVIFSQRIPHVVVLSGDVHTSFSCTLRVKNEPGFGVHGVVSSSFFWPYPHMSRGSFLFDQPLANMGMRTLISELRSDDCFGDDNYTRLEVLPDLRVRVSVYQRKGDPLQADLVL
jgi:alkaline phosphatase D